MSKKKKAPAKPTERNSREHSKLRTSNKRPSERSRTELFGLMAGRMEIVGDVESPIEDWKYWDPAKNLEK